MTTIEAPDSERINLNPEEQQIKDLDQYIQGVSKLITSPNTHQVDLGLKYFPEVLKRLKPFTESAHLQNSYLLFKPIILAASDFNPVQKDKYIKAVNDNDLTIYSAFSEQISTDQHFQTQEWLQRHAFRLLGLSPEETKKIIFDNWANVTNYLTDLNQSDSELTLSTLREVSRLSSTTILPSFAQGFRHDPIPSSLKHLIPALKEINYKYKIFPARGAPADKLESIMQDIINQANSLIQNETSKKRFEVSIASLAGDYASAHPHSDGNGTKTLFFIETCMALRKDYPLLTEYEIDIDKRAQQFLRNNPRAIVILNGKTAVNMIKSSIATLSTTLY